jgi:hypothetical protein
MSQVTNATSVKAGMWITLAEPATPGTKTIPEAIKNNYFRVMKSSREFEFQLLDGTNEPISLRLLYCSWVGPGAPVSLPTCPRIMVASQETANGLETMQKNRVVSITTLLVEENYLHRDVAGVVGSYLEAPPVENRIQRISCRRAEVLPTEPRIRGILRRPAQAAS